MKNYLYALLIVAAMTIFYGCASLSPEVQQLQQSAEHGDTNAMFDLGCAYYYGEGAPQDYAAAVKWYRLAAEHGDVNAMYNLGGIYRYGRGVTVDLTEAAKWYRLAAAQGDAHAVSQSAELKK